MHRRQYAKIVKTIIAILLFLSWYLIFYYAQISPTIYRFVNDDRSGHRYIFMYLHGKAPVFLDTDSANVFKSRLCSYCVMTNNRGFIPMEEYDAVIILDNATVPAVEPGKRYLLETDQQCLDNKLVGCECEPKIVSLKTRIAYSVCDLCRHLHDENEAV